MPFARAASRATTLSLKNYHGVRVPHLASQHQHFSVLVAIGWDPDQSQATKATSNSPSSNTNNHRFPRNIQLHNHQHQQQVRFRRHDRASAFSKPRPKTKKQRKKYNRRMKRLADERAKHNPPGSKAGPLRQIKKERIQQLLDYGTEKDLFDPSAEDEYGLGDALLEDVMGNTSWLTSQPTPEPVYLGHKHNTYLKQVENHMKRYRRAIDTRVTKDNEVLDVASEADLPPDKSIANLIRAYRDRHGTRNKPIGIAKALTHVLKDAGVPTVAFGEYTYNALLTCCRSPKEVRNVQNCTERVSFDSSNSYFFLIGCRHAVYSS